MKNFGKYLLLILAFLSIGETSAFNNTATEVREDLPISSEDLKAVNFSLHAFRENPFQEISDLSNKKFTEDHSTVAVKFISDPAASEAVFLFYVRDLRRDISCQLFPKHFFL